MDASRFEKIQTYIIHYFERFPKKCGIIVLCRYEEIDFEHQLWVVPAFSPSRKTSVKRINPLSKQALQLLDTPKSSGWAFPSISNTQKSVSARTVLDRLEKSVQFLNLPSDIPDRLPTLHGFRATFKSWARHQKYDNDLSEIQLWHSVGSLVQQAYDRDPMIEPRREMMQAWADYCFSLCDEDWWKPLGDS